MSSGAQRGRRQRAWPAGCPKMLLPVCPKAGAERCPNAPPVPKRDGALEAPNAPPVLKVKGEEDAALLAAKGCPNAPGEGCVLPEDGLPPVREGGGRGAEGRGCWTGNRLGVVDGPKTLAADDCPNARAKRSGCQMAHAAVCRACIIGESSVCMDALTAAVEQW